MSSIFAELVKNTGFVPVVWPVNLRTGANNGGVISMKGYGRCCFYIVVGTVDGTVAVTLYEATSVAGAGVQQLSLDKMYTTGQRLLITSPTGVFTVGETVTGDGGATGVVVKASRDDVLLHTRNATAFVDAETITGGTSLYTATANGAGQDEDILLEKAVDSDTFTIPAVSNRTYAIEVRGEDLSDGYDCVQLRLAQAGAGSSSIGVAIAILYEPNFHRIPMGTGIYDAP